MLHLPGIIQDLALILMSAAAMTLIFRSIKQPVVLGYIIAGFLVGSHFSWMPTVLDPESVKVWAEIGVIFLLFALGLEFSFKKLARVGAPASITAVVEVIGMVGIGFALGRLFGWSFIDSLFLGGILAISSTTIIIRAFDELGMKTRGFVRLVFGVLIVEDLVAILLMVVLSTVAVTQTFSGVEMGISALKLLFFLTLWFVAGIFLIPSFLKRTRHLMKKETLLIVSIGLCFLMVVLASKVGFSPALGAFIMGSILAETIEGEKIEHLIEPVKDLFAAIFFVSVGMLIDPAILVEYAKPIFLITVATVIGKVLTTTAGAMLSGQSLRHSVQSGMSLAQIGEFSFIIASLGLSLKVTSDFLYPIAISVSAITTFTTPYLIKSADPTVKFLETHLPTKWLSAYENFRTSSSQVSQTKTWRGFIRAMIIKMFANGVVVTSIFFAVATYVTPLIGFRINHPEIAPLLALGSAFLLSSPFLWAMTFGRIDEEFTQSLWSERSYKATLLVLETTRWITTLLLVAILASRFVPAFAVTSAAFVILVVIFLVLSRYISAIYLYFENRFVTNLHEKERFKNKRRLPILTPWDSHLAKLQISPNASIVGKRLQEAMVRERFGITIALIERGNRVIPAPSPNEVLYPSDVLQVIGTDEQINRFKLEVEESDHGTADLTHLDYALRSILVEPGASYANKTIRNSGLRESTKGLVVGIEKSGQRTLNPDSSILIEPGDVLWVVGSREGFSQL